MAIPQEYYPSLFLALLLLPLTLLLVILSTRGRRRRRHNLPLPPGPRPLPIIGNMLMMHRLNPRTLADLADRYGSLCHLRLGSLHFISIATADMARQVLRTQDAEFSNRPATAAIHCLTYGRADLAFADAGPFWRQMRRLCAVRLFSRRRAESWASVRDEIDTAVRSVANTVDVGKLAFGLMRNVTFRAAFGGGRGNEEQDEFAGIVQEFSRLFGAIGIGDMIPWLGWVDVEGIERRAWKARRSLDGFIDGIVDEHLAKKKKNNKGGKEEEEEPDMVDDMVAFLDDECGGGEENIRLTRDNIKAIIMDVMFGGTETVASTIEWAMSELLKHPTELTQIQQELAHVVGLHRKVLDTDLPNLPFLKSTVKETLRLHPPIPLLFHASSDQDCELAGYSIPARSRIWVNVWAIGRDKSTWTDPDEFRPSRFAAGGGEEGVDFRGNCFEFLPFGSGRRSCPGMQLGLYALELAVAQLLHCFRWALPEGMEAAELDMGEAHGLTAPRAVRLVAVATPRLTCAL